MKKNDTRKPAAVTTPTVGMWSQVDWDEFGLIMKGDEAALKRLEEGVKGEVSR